MKRFLFIPVLFAINISAQDDVRFFHENGFGTRAFSLAGNFVALSNDVSAIYWNPAALSFSLAREINVALDASSLIGHSFFLRNEQSSTMHRLKISSAGMMYSIPATQGGFTFAFSYSNPVVFDDASWTRGTFNYEKTLYGMEKDFKTSGGLKYLSGGFGLQVAPRIGIGAAVSFVYGQEDLESMDSLFMSQDDFFYDSISLYNLKGRYAGYDMRLGAFYKDKIFNAGLRFVLPQVIGLREADNEITYSYFSAPVEYRDRYKWKMYSSFSGAAGLGFTLPLLTISTEARGTLPFGYVFPSKKIPPGSQANYFKVGGGFGLEFPVPKSPLLIRTGYSVDEIDLHRFVTRYDENDYSWDDDDLTIDRNKHQISAGLTFYNSSISFDIAYSYSTWGLTHRVMLAEDLFENLVQDYSMHRVMVSLAVRY